MTQREQHEFPAPDFLTDRARAEWNRVLGILVKRSLFDELKLPSLEAYCIAYGRWVEAELKIRKNGDVIKFPGSDIPRANPFLEVGAKAKREMRAFQDDLGLNEGRRRTVSPMPEDLADCFSSYTTAHDNRH